jgi:pimeloyl-ACP methyl ester carboxylesterase
MSPAVRALATAHDVRTFSLNSARRRTGTNGTLHTFFEAWHASLDHLLEGLERPVPLVGVSFGGVVALTYAAARPERVSHLVLVSTPAPGFQLDGQQIGYLRWPILSAPLFALRAIGRLAPEVTRSLPSWGARTRFAATYVGRTLRYPGSPRLMAGWVREWMSCNLAESCRLVSAPTLVVTGDPVLDHVVPVTNTREYLRLIGGASHATLPDTGHIGLLLKPERFAEIVTEFISRTDHRVISAGEGPTDTCR